MKTLFDIVLAAMIVLAFVCPFLLVLGKLKQREDS